MDDYTSAFLPYLGECQRALRRVGFDLMNAKDDKERDQAFNDAWQVGYQLIGAIEAIDRKKGEAHGDEEG